MRKKQKSVKGTPVLPSSIGTSRFAASKNAKWRTNDFEAKLDQIKIYPTNLLFMYLRIARIRFHYAKHPILNRKYLGKHIL